MCVCVSNPPRTTSQNIVSVSYSLCFHCGDQRIAGRSQPNTKPCSQRFPILVQAQGQGRLCSAIHTQVMTDSEEEEAGADAQNVFYPQSFHASKSLQMPCLEQTLVAESVTVRRCSNNFYMVQDLTLLRRLREALLDPSPKPPHGLLFSRLLPKR